MSQRRDDTKFGARIGQVNPIPLTSMPRRIDIEITSALSDGSWTWRKAGAQKPKGTIDASILPDGVQVGDELKVEAEQMLDGMEILSVVKDRVKAEKSNMLELLPDEKPF